MALLFELVVECGSQRADAEAVSRHFKGLKWTLTDGTEVQTEGGGLYQDEEVNWWSWIRPSGVNGSGATTPSYAQQLTEAGHHLYAHLRTAPRFRFAIAAVEVSESFTARDLPSKLDSVHMHGLVLNLTMWDQLGRPGNFKPFGTDSVWRPYEGERYYDSSDVA